MSKNGFTLVEMLVGLSIFGILAAAGVGLLRSSADTQISVDETLSAQADVERIARLLESDFGQVVNRPSRGAAGELRPAFIGSASRAEFIRGGVVAIDSRARSDLRRVAWQGDTGRLARLTFEQVDGNEDTLPEALLLENATQIALDYRNLAGDWVSGWPDASGEPLPRAVRLTVASADLPPTQFVIALPRIAAIEGAER